MAVAAFLTTGCTSDNTSTPPAPTLDATFVGYTDPTTRQTTCGNCHIEKQRDWQNTKHSHAWNDMEDRKSVV